MKKQIVFILLSLTVCTVVRSHTRGRVHVYSPEQEQSRKKVGLVLSGGGAKGAAHVGVIRVLEEAGIPIDYIAGTSMGAIVGGLYAIGYTVDELDSLVRTQDWPALLRDRVPRSERLLSERESTDRYIVSIPLSRDRRIRIPSGFLAGQNVYNLLCELTVGYHDSIPFHALPIPFTCIAFDMVTGSEIRIDQGILPTAIRASMSIPGAFATVPVDTLVLVDGGVINNFPVDVVREMGAEIVIGSDVTAGMRSEPGQLRNVMTLVNQFTAIIGHAKYAENLKNTDLYIHPDITSYTAGSFSAEAIDTLLRRGEECARAQWDEITALRERIGIGIGPDREWRRPAVERYHIPPWIEIRSIHIEGVSPGDERIIRRRMALREDSGTTFTRIQKEINVLRGTNLYSNVTYQLSGESPFDLTIYLVEASRNSLNLGLRFDTEDMAAILLNGTLGPRGIRGAAVEVTSRLSKNPYVGIDFSIGNTFLGQGKIGYLFSYNNVDLYRGTRKLNNATFARHLIDLGFSQTGLRDSRMTVGAQYDYYDFHDFLFSDPASNEVPVREQGLINYYFDGLWETVDNSYFPTRGITLHARYQLSTDNFVSYQDGPPFHAVSLHFGTAVSVSDRVAFLPVIYGRALFGPNIAFPYWNCVGGSVAGRYLPQQLPFIGFRHIEAAENVLLIGRLDFRVRLWRRHYASLIGNYGWESAALNRIEEGTYMIGGGLNYAYDSPIGPISLLLDYSSRSRKVGAYFSLGRYF